MAFSSVCNIWKHIAYPYLYRALRLFDTGDPQEGFSRLAETLRGTPHIGYCVRTLCIRGTLDTLNLLDHVPHLRSLTFHPLQDSRPESDMEVWSLEPLKSLEYLSITYSHPRILKVLLTMAPSLTRLNIQYEDWAENDNEETWQEWRAPLLALTELCVDLYDPPSTLFLRKLTESSAQSLQELLVRIAFVSTSYDEQSEKNWFASWLPSRMPNVRWLILRGMTCSSCGVFLASCGDMLEYLLLAATSSIPRTWMQHLPGSLQSLHLLPRRRFLPQTTYNVLALLSQSTIWLPNLPHAPEVDIDSESEPLAVLRDESTHRVTEMWQGRLQRAFVTRQKRSAQTAQSRYRARS